MPARGRVRLVDVAREAGTSISTVSRALNGSPLISTEVTERVRAVAGRIGYRADTVAQELKLGRVRTIGVTVPDLANPFFPEFLKGLSAAARDAGHRVLIGESEEDPVRELRLATELADHSAGLVLCSPRLRPAGLRQVLDLQLPVVCVNRPVPGAGQISIDYAAGTRLLLSHLTELGHRRIAYIGGPPASWADGLRRRTLRKLAPASGIELTEIQGGWSGDHGFASGPEVLLSKATAVITFNDLVAVGLMSWFVDNGIEVPAECSVASYDDIPQAAYMRPPLTSLSNQRIILGRLAWAHLASCLGDGTRPRTTLLTPELVIRGSTAPPVRDRA
ncbi:LacI family DNA-binding transcriptional regulator [Kribbella sp. NPDC006257]|uniref:LacI family DNA-binding transcriptional regulator n=1 Tax=Kribbella sp. NPDC006257 TaxID=3156738 RepID=UPI0033A145DA